MVRRQIRDPKDLNLRGYEEGYHIPHNFKQYKTPKHKEVKYRDKDLYTFAQKQYLRRSATRKRTGIGRDEKIYYRGEYSVPVHLGDSKMRKVSPTPKKARKFKRLPVGEEFKAVGLKKETAKHLLDAQARWNSPRIAIVNPNAWKGRFADARTDVEKRIFGVPTKRIDKDGNVIHGIPPSKHKWAGKPLNKQEAIAYYTNMGHKWTTSRRAGTVNALQKWAESKYPRIAKKTNLIAFDKDMTDSALVPGMKIGGLAHPGVIEINTRAYRKLVDMAHTYFHEWRHNFDDKKLGPNYYTKDLLNSPEAARYLAMGTVSEETYRNLPAEARARVWGERGRAKFNSDMMRIKKLPKRVLYRDALRGKLRF